MRPISDDPPACAPVALPPAGCAPAAGAGATPNAETGGLVASALVGADGPKENDDAAGAGAGALAGGAGPNANEGLLDAGAAPKGFEAGAAAGVADTGDGAGAAAGFAPKRFDVVGATDVGALDPAADGPKLKGDAGAVVGVASFFAPDVAADGPKLNGFEGAAVGAGVVSFFSLALGAAVGILKVGGAREASVPADAGSPGILNNGGGAALVFASAAAGAAFGASAGAFPAGRPSPRLNGALAGAPPAVNGVTGVAGGAAGPGPAGAGEAGVPGAAAFMSFSRIFSIAAASRSRFSHFEYVRARVGVPTCGLAGAASPDGSAPGPTLVPSTMPVTRRPPPAACEEIGWKCWSFEGDLGATAGVFCWLTATRRPRFDTDDCRNGPRREGAGLSGAPGVAQRRDLPL